MQSVITVEQALQIVPAQYHEIFRNAIEKYPHMDIAALAKQYQQFESEPDSVEL